MTNDDAAVGILLPRDLPAPSVLPFARRAEQAGFDELWVVEDLGFRGGIAQAAAVLAVTDRIRVGIGILPVGARNVAFTAMELNTLAEMFPGRVDAGIGHGMPGWMRQVGAWPASPLTLLREQSVALRALLRGEIVSVDGSHVRLADVTLEGPAPQVPRVLAGVRGPRSLAEAGRSADGTVLAEPATPEYIAAARSHIGDAPGHRVVAYNVASVHPDAAVAYAAVRPALAWIGEPDWSPHVAPLPFAAELAELRARSASREAFAAALPDAWVAQLAVAGTPDACRARIRQMHDAGAASVVLTPSGPDPLADLDAFATVL
ncbi:LLM class flavin-dependent oxidoreductase [Cellulomonas sp. P22]|uniref:LLM class flavin-dependent oxidoreductase n=1 Tax=Cellulomonas sp. P22 TaxID=3373189 RepID=UPI00379B5E95